MPSRPTISRPSSKPSRSARHVCTIRQKGAGYRRIRWDPAGAIAGALHAQGATLALWPDVTRRLLERLAGELGDRTHVITGDLGDADSADAMLSAATKWMDGIDILVNNAGLTRDNLAMRIKDEDWQQVYKRQPDRKLPAFARGPARHDEGALGPDHQHNVDRRVTGNPGQANYAASKAGIIGMSKSLASEVATRGITVNCIAPGFIETAMTGSLGVDQHAKLMGRYLPDGWEPQKTWPPARYFWLPDEASYVTGQTLHVNGGMAMI